MDTANWNYASYWKYASLVEELKCTKARLIMTLTESENTVIRTAAPLVATGRKWSPAEAVQTAKTALHFQDVVGQVQRRRAGLWLIPKAPQWHKATLVQKRKQIDMPKLSQWWNGLIGSAWWKENWAGSTSERWRELDCFLIRATYDLLPSPQNLKQLFRLFPLPSTCILQAHTIRMH